MINGAADVQGSLVVEATQEVFAQPKIMIYRSTLGQLHTTAMFPSIFFLLYSLISIDI